MSSRKRMAICVLTCFVVSLALAVLRCRRQDDLLPRSTRVADFSTGWQWDSPGSNYLDNPLYAWMSDTRLFFCSTDIAPPRGPFIYDVRSGQRTPLEALKPSFDGADHSVNWWELSRDANWILWQRQADAHLMACKLDGSQTRCWRVPKGCEFRWLNDSRHWEAIEDASSPGAPETEIVGDVDRPTGVVRGPLRGALPWLFPFSEQTSPERTVYSLLGSAVPSGKPGAVELLRNLAVTTPGGAQREQVVSSPDGRRLAWLLATYPRAGLLDYLRKLTDRSGGSEDLKRVALWVSRADGAGMREIGSVLGETGSSQAASPGYLKWLPDGRRVSFVYKYAIWTVPVD